MPWKLRTVPIWKMSYHQPMLSVGTVTFPWRVSTSSLAQNASQSGWASQSW
jgi:hypothetical protein